MEFDVTIDTRAKGKIDQKDKPKITYKISNTEYVIYPDNDGDRFDLFREVRRKSSKTGEFYIDEEEIAYSLTLERLLIRLIEIAAVKKLEAEKRMSLIEYLSNYNNTIDQLIKELQSSIGLQKILNIKTI